MSDYIFKQYSSLEKIFLDELPDTQEFASAGILKGEEFSYQIAYKSNMATVKNSAKRELNIEINSPLKDLISIYAVGNVPSVLPAYYDNCDERYVCAVSEDDGKRYERAYYIEDDLTNNYCYPAMIEGDDYFLLCYYHSNNTPVTLNSLKVTKVMKEELLK